MEPLILPHKPVSYTHLDVYKRQQYKRQWVEVLTRGFSQEEANMAEALLYRMADNAYTYMNLAGKESCNHVPTNGCSNTESLG